MGAKPGGENPVSEGLVLILFILGYALGEPRGGEKKERQSKKENIKVSKRKERARAHERPLEAPRTVTGDQSAEAE